MKTTALAALAPIFLLAPLPGGEGEPLWQEIPPQQWRGKKQVEVTAINKTAAVAVSYPPKEASPLICTTSAALPAGQYAVRVIFRPSHASGGGIISFRSGLRLKAGEETIAEFPAIFFYRPHAPEIRQIIFLHRKLAPLVLTFECFADAESCEKAFISSHLKAGGPKMSDDIENLTSNEDVETEDLDTVLTPDKNVYCVLENIALRPLSHSGVVSSVAIDKIRYLPGETLKGTISLENLSSKGGEGILNLYLEHLVRKRDKMKSIPLQWQRQTQEINFELPLPQNEFGYALIAEYVSADGRDRSEAATYFNIAENFYRVAIFGGIGGQRDMVQDEKTIRSEVAKARACYTNTIEFFAWAEEDMVEMSPDGEYWFSGQTCYRLHKPTLQAQIRLAQEQGISVVTYGKFTMSGYLGWKTAYEYPHDHRRQYFYPVGMWNSVNVTILDRFRNKEFVPYSPRPQVTGNAFNVWWQEFLPIDPDPTPRMVRIAAEEVIRSVEMFGWDGIRWDGHPRGGGQCGGPHGKYDMAAARRTQALVRYFKDIVKQRYPRFRHGYNYLLIQKQPIYEWACEDYELDELCREGGLIMNESIGNASYGWTYDSIARNLQVEGDLCRERGAYYLGISLARSPRDVLVESVLWAAAGARPYNDAMCLPVRRYCTRYSRYVFDENLRRLSAVDKILRPQTETGIWWQPFAYETPAVDGKKQIILNLLNIPRQAKRPKDKSADAVEWDMPPGIEPTRFILSLPKGYKALAAYHLSPWTLSIADLPLQHDAFTAPAVAVWEVVVIDLAVDSQVPPLATEYGPPKTLGVPRQDKDEKRAPEVVLDPTREICEVNKDMSVLAPPRWGRSAAEQEELDKLPLPERNARLMKIRESAPVEKFLECWTKGGSLPDDLRLKNVQFDFGDLAPHRNGCYDILYGRGALDYVLRLPEAFARLDRFQMRDAPLYGALRQTPGMGLRGGLHWHNFPAFDLLLFTGIPHCAIGAENCYAMYEYIKAGGAAFFTGGEYAFGKGGYMHTVLDRLVLPVFCVENIDTRYSEKALILEPGPHFGELKVELDFSVKPSFWVYNEVALKPDKNLRIFLKSGNRPILVGWELGSGRVACLLLDHRGKSEGQTIAFFDWQEWPALLHSLFIWLAPKAMASETRPSPITAEETKKLIDLLEKESVAFDLEKPADGVAGLIEGEKLEKPAPELSAAEKAKRLAAIDRLLWSNGKEVAAALAEQLAIIADMPLKMKVEIIDFIRRSPPANLTAVAKRCLASQEPAVRGSGMQLHAIAGDSAFCEQLRNALAAKNINKDCSRDLAPAIALFQKSDLCEEGKRLLQEWNKIEAEGRQQWTGGKPFSLAAPHHPFLDAETTLQRIAWLAYLSRYEPGVFGEQFCREWLMITQYQDYCDRSISNLYNPYGMTAAQKKYAASKESDWRQLRAYFGWLRDLTMLDVENMILNHPEQASASLAKAHFTHEVRSAMNILGNLKRTAAWPVLEKMQKAQHADLAVFVRSRLQSKNE